MLEEIEILKAASSKRPAQLDEMTQYTDSSLQLVIWTLTIDCPSRATEETFWQTQDLLTMLQW